MELKQLLNTIILLFISLFILQGCHKPNCTETECTSICDKQVKEVEKKFAAQLKAVTLSDFEHKLLDPILEEVKKGVKPFAENSIGICKGQGKECKEFVGLESKELPEGEYMLRAELSAPNIGEKGTWQVQLDTNCTSYKDNKKDDSTTTKRSKKYSIWYTGKDHGFRLSPLYKITSPSKGGKRTCEWSLTTLNGDQKGEIFKGSWTVPSAK